MGTPSHDILEGIAVSPGLGDGVIFIHDHERVPTPHYEIKAGEVDEEVRRFEQAVDFTRRQLRETHQMVTSRLDKTHAAIFEAQELLLEDPLLTENCIRHIREQRDNAEFALEKVVNDIRRLFEQIDVPHFSTQNLDVLDVASRIRENLMPESKIRLDQLARNSILVARDLRPSDTARLNNRHVLGIVTEMGGPTSHSAILARALNIPAIVGVENVLERCKTGDMALVDGYTGRLTINPTKNDQSKFKKRQSKLKAEAESLLKFRDLPCETRDGYPIELAANIEFPQEVEAVKKCGARGIGLFRSEFFYIDRGCIPTEEEQYQVYREILEKMAPDPVICRTLDLGGDKFLSHTGMSEDMNPFLGLRAIRLCLANPDIFRSQLRAMMRASAFGNMKIMIPFITDISEVLRSKSLIAEIKNELDREGLEYDKDLEVGIMIETPAAALSAERLAEEVDFFSIGTNDLIQYTMAVDRVNEFVAELYNPLHPAVISLIRRTVEAGHRAGIWVGVCGEMASDPALAALLMGLGIDEISMSSVAVLEVKQVIRSVQLADVRKLRQDVLACVDETEEVHRVVAQFRRKHVKSPV